MADFTCPAGFTKNIDLDSNTDFCMNAAGNRAPAIYATQPMSVVAVGGLAAVAIVIAALAFGSKKKKHRRRR